jgi:hypothetical protein
LACCRLAPSDRPAGHAEGVPHLPQGSAGTYRRALKEGLQVDPELARLVLEVVKAGFVLVTLVVLGVLFF